MKFALVASLLAAVFAAFIGQRFMKLREVILSTREVGVKHLPNCQLLKNLDFGAEDLTILSDGRAIMSTGLKYPGLPSFSEDPGKMYTLDLLDSTADPVELKIQAEQDLLETFNPHGISVFRDDKDDSVHVMVVNHPQPRHSRVEIFHLEENTLIHLNTVTHDLLHSVNDIVAVGVDSFLATNDQAFPSEALHLLSVLLGFPLCTVVYYSPAEVTEVAGGFLSANGINMSPDGRFVYVSDILEHEIEVFERLEGQRLTPVKTVSVGSLCDNIEVDQVTGDLWLGCHPNGYKFITNDPNDPPGSEVIRVQNIQSDHPLVTQVFADDGTTIIGSSVAAPYGGKLLIGSVYHKALSCDLE